MKISRIRIQNFRIFQDQTINLDDYTCLVGPNGTGKSTVLTALNIFFRETANAATNLVELDDEDFHQCNTKEPVRITVTFTDLSNDAQTDFKDYFRVGELTVAAVAEFDAVSKTAQVRQYGQRLGIEQFRILFEQEKSGAAVKDLKETYETIQQTYPQLPKPGTKASMIEALRTFEGANPDLCSLIPSEDQFYGISRGKNLLEKYVQWVYIPAVKDAATERLEGRNTALSKLLDRTVRAQVNLDQPIGELKMEVAERYQVILNNQRSALQGLKQSLQEKLQQWAHRGAGINLDWQEAEKAVNIAKPLAQVTGIEGQFEGEIPRFGHGFQRSFIFALLQELSGTGANGPKLLLGCEEPELYQHPPQARYLASLLQKLSTQNSQIIASTHSPYFVSGKAFEQIRVVLRQEPPGCAVVRQTTFERIANAVAAAVGEKPTKPGGIAAKVEQDMQSPLNEMFFARVRILVEGLEDVAYISSYISLLTKMEEFRQLGCHIVPAQGKSNLIQALAIANDLGLKAFTVFDSDSDVPDDASGKRKRHEQDNTAILTLAGIAAPQPFPPDHLWHQRVVMWKTKIGDVIESDLGKDKLVSIRDAVRKKYGIFVANMDKNTLLVSYVLAEAWEQGLRLPMLERLCTAILDYARSG